MVQTVDGSQWQSTQPEILIISQKDLFIHSQLPAKVRYPNKIGDIAQHKSQFQYSAGKWTAVTGVSISDFSREKLTATANELEEEKKFAFEFLKIA